MYISDPYEYRCIDDDLLELLFFLVGSNKIQEAFSGVGVCCVSPPCSGI